MRKWILVLSCLLLAVLGVQASAPIPTTAYFGVNLFSGQPCLDSLDYTFEWEGDRVVQVSHQGMTVQLTYEGQATEVEGPGGKRSTYQFDAFGNLTALQEFVHGDDSPTPYRHYQWQWDPTGQFLQQASLRDAEEQVHAIWAYHYDERGRLIEERLFGPITGHGPSLVTCDPYGRPLPSNESYGRTYTYEGERLVQIQEDNGRQILFQYNSESLLTGKLLAYQGNVLLREFYRCDDQGRILERIADDGNSFDQDDLTGATQRKGTLLTPNQDHPGSRLPQVVEERFWDPDTDSWQDLALLTCSYDEQGRLLCETRYDAQAQEQHETLLRYDAEGRLKERCTDGIIEHLSYDTENQVVESFLPQGQVSTLRTYDEFNRRIAERQIHGNGLELQWTYEFDEAGRLCQERDSFGQCSKWEYDSLGRKVLEIRPGLRQQRFEYDLFDRIICHVDELGYRTEITYNLHGDPLTILYPDGSEEQFYYHLDGSLASRVHRDGVVTGYSHDALGRVTDTAILASDFDQAYYESQEYEGLQLKQIYEATGTVQSFSYDSAGRLINIERDNGHHTSKRSFSYSGDGRLDTAKDWYGYGLDDYLVAQMDTQSLQVRDAQGELHKYLDLNQYASINRPAAYDESWPLGGQSTILSDVVNQDGDTVLQVHHTNDQGLTRVITYNVSGEVEQEELLDPFGQVLSSRWMEYDAKGHKIRELHERGADAPPFVIEWEYGPMGRLERIVEAGSRETRFLYNHRGQITRRIKPDGNAIIYEYDGLGHLARLASKDGSVDYRFTHDTAGHIIECHDQAQNTLTLRVYDGLDHPVYEQLGNGLEILSDYDRSGRLSRLELPEGSEILFEYEGPYLHKIHRFTRRQSWTHTLEYNLEGQVCHSDLAGQAGEIDWNFDPNGLVESIESTHWGQYIPDEARDQEQEISQILWRDPNGLHEAQYTYSSTKQLETEDGIFQNTYGYDRLENRVSANDSGYTVDEWNQILQAGDTLFQYDANGNLIERVSPDGRTEFTYDALNRLIRAEVANELAVNYQYDGLNRRIRAEYWSWCKDRCYWQLDGERRFLYHDEREIGAYNEAGFPVELRVLNPERPSEMGAAVAIELEGEVYVPIHDHQGSVRCLIQADTGDVEEFYQYSAFGQERCFNSSGEEYRAKNPWRFCSKRLDQESGWLYFGRRHYLPELGRWNSVDPMGYFDGPNLYAYTHNNPLCYKDWYGLYSVSEAWDSLCQVGRQLAWAVVNGTRELSKQISDRISLVGQMSRDLEAIASHCLGTGFLRVAGYYMENTSYGVVGHGELNDRVRITYINGILNSNSCCRESAESISQTHGGSNVHFIHSATSGFTWDLLKGMMAKTGYVSAQATMLAHCWKAMIEEMGGVDCGGRILHYAHSMGGTDTCMATTLLTPEERQMIQVISFGSATLIPESHYGEVVNYVSYRDGIPMTDPLGFLRGLLNKDANVVFVGSFQGVPFVDHFFSSPTYQGVLNVLGSRFVETYGYPH